MVHSVSIRSVLYRGIRYSVRFLWREIFQYVICCIVETVPFQFEVLLVVGVSMVKPVRLSSERTKRPKHVLP